MYCHDPALYSTAFVMKVTSNTVKEYKYLDESRATRSESRSDKPPLRQSSIRCLKCCHSDRESKDVRLHLNSSNSFKNKKVCCPNFETKDIDHLTYRQLIITLHRWAREYGDHIRLLGCGMDFELFTNCQERSRRRRNKNWPVFSPLNDRFS